MAVDYFTKNRIWQNVMGGGPSENLPQNYDYTGWPRYNIYKATILVIGYLELGGFKKLGQEVEYSVCSELREIHKNVIKLFDEKKISEASRDELLKRLKYLKDVTKDYYTVYGDSESYESSLYGFKVT